MLMSPRKSPVSPPTPKTNTVPSANSIGVSKRIEPFQTVSTQFSTTTIDGHADEQREQHEALAEQRAHAGHEHVVAVDHRGEDGHDDHRPHRAAVPVVRLAREEGEDVADDPPGREDQDVDLGVAEDPEQVLVEDRIAAAAHRRRAREEELRAEAAVEQEQERRRAEHRDEERVQDRGEPEPPDRERQAHVGHPGRAQADDRRDVVHCAHRRGDAGDEDARRR